MSRPTGLTLFLTARFFSMIAVQMQSVAVGWEVYALTQRPVHLGYVGLAQFLPMVTLSLFTGVAADRFDRRRIIMACQIAYAGCAAFLFARTTGIVTGAPLAGIYTSLVAFGTARAFHGPAGQALLPALVPAGDFPRAVAWSSSLFQGAMVAGPALGGALLSLFGIDVVYATCVVLTVASSAIYSAMPPVGGLRETRSASVRTLLAGVDYVWKNKPMLGSISLDLFAVLLGGAVALLPIYAKDILSAGPTALGLLRGAPGFGAIVTALVLAVRPLRRNAGVWMFGSVAMFGIATIVFGYSKNVALSIAALVVVGAADMVSVVIRHTLVQLATPEAMRGRVSAVNLVFIGASNELGEFESGIVAEWLGPVGAVVTGGLGTLAVVVLWALLFPQLRRVDRLADESSSPE